MPAPRNAMALAESYRRYCLITGYIRRTYPDGLGPLDTFAELISGGPEEDWALLPFDAAREMGYRPDYGNAMMQRLKKAVGDRAI